MASQKSDNRHVNHLLHTLRGEQFRHSQNVRKSKTHVSASFLRNKPTLPIDLTSLDYDTVFKSSSEESSDRYETASWRSKALSLLFSQLEGCNANLDVSRPPPLTMLCLEYLMARSTMTELREDILPYIPSHLRASWVRYTATHAPLSNQRLFALYEEEGHADGEIFVVGPNNSLRDDYFLQASPSKDNDETGAREDAMEEDWDAEEPSPVLLRTVAILSSRLSSTTILSLPPTIAHLALIHLPTPIALHRLPQVCPLLEFLDLSYNDWLAKPSKDTTNSWERIDWGRWNQLKTLGLRETGISEEWVEKVNHGRWEDIEIVR